ncbi:hypothetical protein ES703_95194 [subsurface metagenome]
MIIEFSDAHENPQGMSQQLREIIALARADGATLVCNGDFINLLPWGYDKWPGSPFLAELRATLRGYDLWLVSGNHDPCSWLKALLGDWPNVFVRRRIVWASPHTWRDVEFRHGHGWSPDWRVLRHFAPGFVEFMTDTFPKQWYWFSRKMGWLPSKLKEEKEQDYRKAILSVWLGAVGHAQRKDRTVICGHTHSQGSLTVGKEILVADAGTLLEGEFIRIDRGIELCKL